MPADVGSAIRRAGFGCYATSMRKAADRFDNMLRRISAAYQPDGRFNGFPVELVVYPDVLPAAIRPADGIALAQMNHAA